MWDVDELTFLIKCSNTVFNFTSEVQKPKLERNWDEFSSFALVLVVVSTSVVH